MQIAASEDVDAPADVVARVAADGPFLRVPVGFGGHRREDAGATHGAIEPAADGQKAVADDLAFQPETAHPGKELVVGIARQCFCRHAC